MFRGSYTALITPFSDDKVDEGAFQSFVEWQIEQGAHGVVPGGTTGESPTLSHDEHSRVVELCVEAAAGRVPVIAGTGSNSTAEAVALTQHAKQAGADGALLVSPYYNKPTQEGLFRHFKAVQDAVDIPIVLYNIPSRSAVDIRPETMERLSQLPNIVGIKDATGDMARVGSMRLLLGSEFCQMSGEDAAALGFMVHGGHGCISVTANVAPALCARFQEACLEGDFGSALALQDRLLPLHSSLFIESSPGPVKYGVSLLGKCSGELRLPLVAPVEDTREKVRAAMTHVGVLH
jgi:4-hydroxy-tetrahydrodipicolinate synthase